MKTAIITGLGGMDGTILTEQLLEKDYKVYGLVRRTARGSDLNNANHLRNHSNLEVVEGDITDLSSLTRLCTKARADFFYHTAAMSHVGSSFEQPNTTISINTLGTLNCLEAIRLSGIHTRFLHCATSEMFGGLTGQAANETTPFHPRSPYGVSKVGAYWATINYRESYKMFACNSICFNHECFSVDTPILIKNNKEEINIIYLSDLVPYRTYKEGNSDTNTFIRHFDDQELQVWDGNNWAKLKTVSRTKIKLLAPENQEQNFYNARGGSIRITPNHNIFTKNEEKIQIKNINIGDDLLLGKFPCIKENKELTIPFAKFLGILAGDGYILNYVQLSNTNKEVRNWFDNILNQLFCNISVNYKESISGYNGTSGQTIVNGLSQNYIKYLRSLIYHEKRGQKRVPQIILNANIEVQKAFLEGYFKADGLKAGTETYEYSSFKTESPLLAQGVLFLVNSVTKQSFNINTFIQNDKTYHQINLHSPNNPHNFGIHKKKSSHELKKITHQQNKDKLSQHVFNIETSTGKIMAGIGNLIVANSPYRSDTFVTKKITRAVANIKLGKQDALYLGNLDAKRDWGWAADFTQCMQLILEAASPDDYVLATGETHTVREFCEHAFSFMDLDYRDYVKIDPKFYRPAEVHVLIGDYSKIKNKLGWEPQTTFKELVERMVEYDYKQLLASSVAPI